MQEITVSLPLETSLLYIHSWNKIDANFFKQLYKSFKADVSSVSPSSFTLVQKETFVGSGGIRTHAIEMTGALNQRLRPLGHATIHV